MRINFFDLLEGVIRGIVHFLYNFAYSLWQILRHPVRGSLRLHTRYLRDDRQQMGGLTFLFLLLFLLLGWIGASERTRLSHDPAASGQPDLMGFVAHPPALESREAWVTLLGALVALIVVDASVRLLAHLRWRHRPQRARLVPAIFEFALTWPVCALAGLIALSAAFSPIYGGSWQEVVLMLLAAGLPLATIPPARVLLLGLGLRRSGSGRTAGAVRMGGMVLAVTLLSALSLWLGMETTREARWAGEADGPIVLEPIGFDCEMASDDPHLDIALRNTSTHDLFVVPHDYFRLHVMSRRDVFRSYPIEFAADSRPVLFAAGGSQILRIPIPPAIAAQAEEPHLCIVREIEEQTLFEIDWEDYGPLFMRAWELMRENAERAEGAR